MHTLLDTVQVNSAVTRRPYVAAERLQSVIVTTRQLWFTSVVVVAVDCTRIICFVAVGRTFSRLRNYTSMIFRRQQW